MCYNLDQKTQMVLENESFEFKEADGYLATTEFKLGSIFKFGAFKGILGTFKFRGIYPPNLSDVFMSCDTGPVIKIKKVDENNILRKSILEYKIFNTFHRIGGPAKIRHNNDKKSIESLVEYLQFGYLHRLDGPAVIKTNKIFGWGEEDTHITQYKKFYQFGNLHNENGPAIIKKINGNLVMEEHYMFGYLHKKDGPAAVHYSANGSSKLMYYQFGKLHREDGPSIIMRKADGSINERYFLFDKELSKTEYNRLLSENILQDVEEIQLHFKIVHGVIKTKTSTKYYQFGLLHNENGPAVIENIKLNRVHKISQRYYQFGKFHRLDGPASILYEIPFGMDIPNNLYFFDDPNIDVDEYFAKYCDGFNSQISLKIYYLKFGLSHRDIGYSNLLYIVDQYSISIRKYKNKFNTEHLDLEDNEPTMILEAKKFLRGGDIEYTSEKNYNHFGLSHKNNGPAWIKERKTYRSNMLIKKEDKIKYKKYGLVHKDYGAAYIEEIKEYNDGKVYRLTIRTDYMQCGIHHNLYGPAIEISTDDYENQQCTVEKIYSILGNYFSSLNPNIIFRNLAIGPFIFGLSKLLLPTPGESFGHYFNRANLHKRFIQIQQIFLKYVPKEEMRDIFEEIHYSNTILEEIFDHDII